MLRTNLLVPALLWSSWTFGTHVLGGEMYYDHLGGDQYQVTLKLYRDCGPGNVNGTGFDTEAQLAIYDGNGILQFAQSAFFPGEESVPVELNDPCLAAPPSICVSWAEYVTVLDLPPNATGYVISYQRCCRTPTMVNLPTGILQGLTCTVQVPPASAGTNSSPRFNEYPPVALCLDRDMVFDHSASDPDGDELVYDLYTPFAGGDALNPAPLASPPPYSNILWGPGYSATDPIDGDPGLVIDPATGTLSVHPTLLGSFAVGVRVREFRNGQQIGESIRDLRFDVVACDLSITSSIQEQQEFCSGLTVVTENQSVNGEFWHWDFGDPATGSDTSSLFAPQWTYADTGTYTITLIANPGWPCADTSSSTFEAYLPLSPFFERPAIRCPNEPAQFVLEGSFTPNAAIVWELGDVSVPEIAFGPETTAQFSLVGSHPVHVTVQEHGCEESYVDSVVVHPRPELTAMTDRSGCVNTAFNFIGSAAAWTPVRHLWTFGDGATSNALITTHIYTVPGTYDVVLTVATDEGCVDEQSIILNDHVEVFPRPIAGFTVEPDEVSLMDPTITVRDHAQLAEHWEYMIDGIAITAPSFEHEFADAGRFEITQVVTSGANCTDALTLTVNVTDHLFYAPNAFTPDGDGVNDTWSPSVLGARSYEVIVHDRLGVERFRSTDPGSVWSGDELPQGVYEYVVRIAEYGAFRKEYRGHVTLLR